MSGSKARLPVLVALLAGLWILAIVTDRPMPGWGQSKFPWFYVESLVYIAILFPIGLFVRWVFQRRRSFRR